MRRALSTAMLVALLCAGCGSESGPTADEAAKAFMDCFKVPGYTTVKPTPQQGSLFALEAERKGFPNAPVNIVKGQQTFGAVFLVFFDSGDEAKEALDEVGRSPVGDIEPQQRGQAVVGYGFDDDKVATEDAINGCL